MWVRYLIGNEDGRPVYRACEVLCESLSVYAFAQRANRFQLYLTTKLNLIHSMASRMASQ